jgi:hypothetical protein
VDYTIACSALAAPSQCHPAPVLQSVLVASFLANFLASVYSPECLEEEFCELLLYGVLRSSHQPRGTGIMTASEGDTLEGETVTDAEKNKQTVIAYYNMAFNERKPAEAAQKYAGLTTSSTTPKPQMGSRPSSSSWRASWSSSPR